MIDIFTILGPSEILQPDNAKNMAKIATYPTAGKIELDQVYVSNVIEHIKHLWPEVNLVQANPRCSSGNGGIEKYTGTSLVRVGHWCVKHQCPHWSLGNCICCWR